MEIRELTKEIRDRSIEYAKPKELDRLSTSWYQEDLLYSGKGKTIFLILPTPGCSWALGPSGGCTMCSYISDCYLKPIENSKSEWCCPSCNYPIDFDFCAHCGQALDWTN